MIVSDNIKFGDTVFVVDIKNNAFNNKKIRMTDENGVEWYRYEKSHYEYNIIEIIYCGKVYFTEEGDVGFDEDRQIEYHFKYPNNSIYTMYKEDIDFMEEWFLVKSEAEQFIEDHKKDTWLRFGNKTRGHLQ